MTQLFFTAEPEMKITALAPWFGSNRMLAPLVGKELGKLDWCGIPFAGSMCEIPEIQSREFLVNDLHRDVINLAVVARKDESRRQLINATDEAFFHPDVLLANQNYCKSSGPPDATGDMQRAVSYFISVWQGRSAVAGKDEEFDGKLAVRFTASGGGSNVRYRSAIESLEAWGKVLKRCEFTVLDFREFLKKCHNRKRHGIYVDAPFPDAGGGYRHKFSDSDQRDLAGLLTGFGVGPCRIVIRFYDHPLIRELYPESRWNWNRLKGRKQSNAEAPEVLLTNGKSYLNSA